jgi:hypothetical protein
METLLLLCENVIIIIIYIHCYVEHILKITPLHGRSWINARQRRLWRRPNSSSCSNDDEVGAMQGIY